MRSIRVVGATTAYIDAGSGPPIVLVNAGLGASTVWRRLIPTLAQRGRVLAVDLLGTGSSGRMEPESDSTYRLAHLRSHLDTFLQLMGVHEPATLVVLGLSSMPVLDWAATVPERVSGVCLMEAVVEPWTSEQISPSFAPMVHTARSNLGEAYVLFSDDHLEESMRTQVMPPLEPDDVARFRKAYGPTHETRRAQLSLLRQIPIDGKPAESAKMVAGYHRWLRETDIPKLLILGNPGHILQGSLADSARDLPNQKVVEVIGTHLLPEDSPDGVARFLVRWLERV